LEHHIRYVILLYLLYFSLYL